MSEYIYSHEDPNSSIQKSSKSRINVAEKPNGVSAPGCNGAAEEQKTLPLKPEPLFIPTEAWQGRLELYLWKPVYKFLNETGGFNRRKFAGSAEYHQACREEGFIKMLRWGNSQTFEAFSFGLEPRELIFLSWVRARTWRWYKFGEIITKSHLVNGIVDKKTGETVQDPICISYPTAVEAIKSLLARGEISRFPVALAGENGGNISYFYMPLNRTVLCQQIAFRLCHQGLWGEFSRYLKNYKHDSGHKLSSWQLWLAEQLFSDFSRCTGAAWLERQQGRLSDVAYGLSVPMVFESKEALLRDLYDDIEKHMIMKDGVQYFCAPMGR